MTTPCSKCGAPLGENEGFCTKCGTSRNQVLSAQTPAFCAKCGKPLEAGASFCRNCGAAVPAAGAVPVAPSLPPPAPDVPAPPPSVAPPATPPVPIATAPTPPPPVPLTPVAAPAAMPPSPPPKVTQGGKGCLTIALIVLAIVLFIIAACVGGCVYLGYRVKKKAQQITAEVKQKEEQQQHQQQNAGVESPSACPALDPAQSTAFRNAAAAASIPLKTGLTLIDLWTNSGELKGRDVETLDTVASIDDNSVTINQARTAPPISSHPRVVCIADMMNGRLYQTQWQTELPAILPGTTKFSMSQAMFQDWKAGRPAQFTLQESTGAGGGRYRVYMTESGTLSREGADDVPYSAIVNGEKKDLPTIKVHGSLGGKTYDAWVLDDPANPLTLNLVNSTNYHITYVKINYPVEKKIEQDLENKGRAEIYGIYFDFDSANLRAESEPVLKEISEALKDHPAWKIRIEGHTDNVGGNDYNQRLSQRRAEAVKQALITQYGITEDRMTPQGFGASRPKATNETIEGRALNRRVELVREGQ